MTRTGATSKRMAAEQSQSPRGTALGRDRFGAYNEGELMVGLGDDRFELEADRVADTVVNNAFGGEIATGATALQMAPLASERPHASSQSAMRNGGLLPPRMSAQIEGMRGRGVPLAPSLRGFYEPRFGQDFADVRVHADQTAASMADAVGARAFAIGRDIFFGNGAYSPETHSGQVLLAHELTHVIQQRSSSAARLRSPGGGSDVSTGAPSGQLQRRVLTRQERKNDPDDLKKAKRRLGILKGWLRKLERRQLDPGPLRAKWAHWAKLLHDAGEINIDADYNPVVRSRIESLDASALPDSGQDAARVPDHLPEDIGETDTDEPGQQLPPCDIGSVALAIDPLLPLVPSIYLTDAGDLITDKDEFQQDYLAYAEDACLVEIRLGEHEISWDFGDQGPALGSVRLFGKRQLGKNSVPVKLTGYIIKAPPCLPCFSGTFDWLIDFNLKRTFNAGKQSSRTASGSTVVKGSAEAPGCIHPPRCSIDRSDNSYPFDVHVSEQGVELRGDLFDFELKGRIFYGGRLHGPQETHPASDPKPGRSTA